MGGRVSNSNQLSLDVETYPTKELFITMLTRDVGLIPAIIDLADNCTDGARRVKPSGKWNGFWISIETKNGSFKIEDNCGGIEVDAARDYAFKFGRPPGVAPVKGAVGRFGVGMKRGLFKLGGSFSVTSTTAESQFKVTVDVEEWAAKKDEWPFQFDKQPLTGQNFPESKRGTVIEVTRLHESVAEQFRLESFEQQLCHELTAKLETSITMGMAIEVNGVALKAHVRQLISHRQLKPAYKHWQRRNPGGGTVTAEIYCGIGRTKSPSEARSEAGWYVFCNGRMLLEADKSSATGWDLSDEVKFPAFHGQYNGFRGYAYLVANDAGDLPWNTTKTALDADHPIYRAVRQEMILLARPVITFFNKMKKEQDDLRAVGNDGKGPIETLLDAAKATLPVGKGGTRSAFLIPQLPAKKLRAGGPGMQSIAFKRPTDKALEVRRTIGANSWPETGELLFDYYFANECDGE